MNTVIYLIFFQIPVTIILLQSNWKILVTKVITKLCLFYKQNIA